VGNWGNWVRELRRQSDRVRIGDVQDEGLGAAAEREDSVQASTTTAPKSLADKIDHLFRSVRTRDGEMTYREASRKVDELGLPGITISPSYIHQLRSGARDNPTMRHLEALAAVFGVPVAYFFDEAVTADIDDQLELLVALRDSGVQNLALRAAGLSDRGRSLIAELIERTRDLESGRP
jgi:transcriptional regulator with XRE-family HTH domain